MDLIKIEEVNGIQFVDARDFILNLFKDGE